jgi:hypothetical protein
LRPILVQPAQGLPAVLLTDWQTDLAGKLTHGLIEVGRLLRQVPSRSKKYTGSRSEKSKL